MQTILPTHLAAPQHPTCAVRAPRFTPCPPARFLYPSRQLGPPADPPMRPSAVCLLPVLPLHHQHLVLKTRTQIAACYWRLAGWHGCLDGMEGSQVRQDTTFRGASATAPCRSLQVQPPAKRAHPHFWHLPKMSVPASAICQQKRTCISKCE